MSEAAASPQRDPCETARLAAEIFAVDPHGTGLCVRGCPGAPRDEWLSLLRGLFDKRPFRKLPLGIADDRLLGGVDLAATLARGSAVAERGLLAEADGGVLVVLSAERLTGERAARIALVHDRGELRLEREGLAQVWPARFGLALIDESLDGEDEAPPRSLLERVAIRIDLSGHRHGEVARLGVSRRDIIAAERMLDRVTAPEAAIEALCKASAALGIGSIRAPLLALRVARIAAALDGRGFADSRDLALAGELVLSWRARIGPEAQDQPDEEPRPDDEPTSDEAEADRDPANADALSEIVIEAARAAIPADLLAHLKDGRAAGRRAENSGASGMNRRSLQRGRRAGVMQGGPKNGARLDIVSTLRAAAPWQKLRRNGRGRNGARFEVRSGDFRIARFIRHAETLTIFAVDASGSQALQRMGEAKGAVERLLGECYVRRDQVALIAFSGKKADLLLPPTRSLVRAKRNLTGLPAGGGTPLANGIDAAILLAQAALRRGQTPLIVLLTDGRANIARDGRALRQAAAEDALASARLVRAAGVKTLLIDTAAQPEPRARQLAEAMGAVYLALPYVNSGVMSAAIKEARAL